MALIWNTNTIPSTLLSSSPPPPRTPLRRWRWWSTLTLVVMDGVDIVCVLSRKKQDSLDIEAFLAHASNHPLINSAKVGCVCQATSSSTVLIHKGTDLHAAAIHNVSPPPPSSLSCPAGCPASASTLATLDALLASPATLFQPLPPLAHLVDRMSIATLLSSLTPSIPSLSPPAPSPATLTLSPPSLVFPEPVHDDPSFPLVLKPRVASSCPLSHTLLWVRSKSVLHQAVAEWVAALAPLVPEGSKVIQVVAEPYIPHPSGVTHKVYVCGSSLTTTCKPSLAAKRVEDSEWLVFTAKSLKPLATGPGNGDGSDPVLAHTQVPAVREAGSALARYLADETGLSVFGLDLLVDDKDAIHVVDINFFPSFSGSATLYADLVDVVLTSAGHQEVVNTRDQGTTRESPSPSTAYE